MMKTKESVELAKKFHDIYEKLAPNFGYETRKDTREFAEHTANGQLMIAVCKEILQQGVEGGQALACSVCKRAKFLECLEAAGVDNWDGYDYACELQEKEIKGEE